jgi:tRNA threonylcarbamoyl adenosine modification protein YeaZ
MKILALDTSSDACSVAVFDAETSTALAEERTLISRGHAELLFSQIDRAAKAAQVPLMAFDRFAVTIGPGTFTGVRIGLAAARGLALAASKPLVGVSSLEVLAADAPVSEVMVAAIDARRGELYLQAFLAGRAIIEAQVAATESAAAMLIKTLPNRSFATVGTGAEALAAALAARGAEARATGYDPFPKAMVLARLAARRPANGSRPRPLYLRAPDAKPKGAPFAAGSA